MISIFSTNFTGSFLIKTLWNIFFSSDAGFYFSEETPFFCGDLIAFFYGVFNSFSVLLGDLVVSLFFTSFTC
jgi:hypothetical protein